MLRCVGSLHCSRVFAFPADREGRQRSNAASPFAFPVPRLSLSPPWATHTPQCVSLYHVYCPYHQPSLFLSLSLLISYVSFCVLSYEARLPLSHSPLRDPCLPLPPRDVSSSVKELGVLLSLIRTPPPSPRFKENHPLLHEVIARVPF